MRGNACPLLIAAMAASAKRGSRIELFGGEAGVLKVMRVQVEKGDKIQHCNCERMESAPGVIVSRHSCDRCHERK